MYQLFVLVLTLSLSQAVREQVEHNQGRRVRQPRQPQRTQSFTQQDHHDWREVLQESKQFESFEAGQQPVGRLERSCLLSGQPQMAQRLDEQPSVVRLCLHPKEP